jgi:hypothetical protein
VAHIRRHGAYGSPRYGGGATVAWYIWFTEVWRWGYSGMVCIRCTEVWRPHIRKHSTYGSLRYGGGATVAWCAYGALRYGGHTYGGTVHTVH